ncbi:MAG: hypothetical protein K9M45_01930 [Kiritimatiellales bacterium]|nr:hypothetical protein [Kiritimatiellales bacterium]
MIKINESLTTEALLPDIGKVFTAAGKKIHKLSNHWNPEDGAPVFTIEGQYTARGWTEWTQGFQFGMPLLQFEATGDAAFLEMGREATVKHMAPHITHTGVHDHGFNNVSTYGNLLRLARSGKIDASQEEINFYELALKASGAVQAARWTKTHDGSGYIYSFNGPHSLFSDTVRSLRALAVSHQLGHVLMGEHDEKINLLERIILHAETTAKYNVYFGEGRDRYDIRGRVVHESIFNLNDGRYRCPSSQQGYSPFTTWTRGHAWILCGFAEQLEWLSTLGEEEFEAIGQQKTDVLARFEETARATADFYIEQTPTDGIPYWDTGAPGLVNLGDYLDRPAEPFNDHEPVDSSAAAIAAQGLLRLGRYLGSEEYFKAGLTTAQSLFSDTYLSSDPEHEGLLLHSVYHHPNGWDHIPAGRKVPCGEACMWGDYHQLELAVYLQALEKGETYTFFPA